MANQFNGMTDIPFSYDDYEQARAQLIADANAVITDDDKEFMVNFELGNPNWETYEFAYLRYYPSVRWKLMNIEKLAKQNPNKLVEQADKLKAVLRQ